MRYIGVHKKGGSDRKRKFTYTVMTESLAYLLGVYLGDGGIMETKSKNSISYTFYMGAVDREFVEYTRDCFIDIFGNCITSLKTYDWMHKQKETWNINYAFSVTSHDLCKWMMEITDKKAKLPSSEFIPREKCDITKAFIEGFIDSEGYIVKKGFECGFSNTSLWTHEFADLVKLFGVKLRKPLLQTLPSRKIYISYSMHPLEFYNAGFKFHIERKQKLLEQHVNHCLTSPLWKARAHFHK